jgi:hypothetical protein
MDSGLNQPISTQAVENMNKNGQLRVCCIVKKNGVPAG